MTIERTNRERTQRFMELARTHTTAAEIDKQMKERQKRLTNITLELAGDLDEQGEAELHSAANSLDAKRVQTRREVLDSFSKEAYLRGVVTKLRLVTGVQDASDMLARYFSQKELFAELQVKHEEKSGRMQTIREDLVNLQANKLDLQGQMESGDRLSTSTLLDMAQKKLVGAQRKMYLKAKRSSHLEVLRVEAKEMLLRTTAAAQPLTSLQSLLGASGSGSGNNSPAASDSNGGGGSGNADGGGDRPRSLVPISWEADALQILRQFEIAAQLMYAPRRPPLFYTLTNLTRMMACCSSHYRMDRFNELVPRSRTLEKFVLRPHNVRITLPEGQDKKLLLLGGAGGTGDQQQELLSTPSHDPLQAPLSSASSRKSAGGSARRPTARRKILSPLKGRGSGSGSGSGSAAGKARKPLASLGENNSIPG